MADQEATITTWNGTNIMDTKLKELPLMWSCPQSIGLGPSGHYTEAAGMFGNIPGAGLGTFRNSLTAPLVWCWHPMSNLDLTRFLSGTINGTDILPFLAEAESASYVGTMGIKWFARGHNSKAQARNQTHK